MASGDGLREFARTVNDVFTTTPITVNLKYDVPVKVGKFPKQLVCPFVWPVCFADISQLNIVSHGVADNTPSPSLMKVFLSHAAFKTGLQPDASFDDDFYAKCTAEVNAINLFFPDVKSDSIRISFTAWLAFICVFDDTLEKMPTPEKEATLRGCIELLKGGAENPGGLFHVLVRLFSLLTEGNLNTRAIASHPRTPRPINGPGLGDPLFPLPISPKRECLLQGHCRRT